MDYPRISIITPTLNAAAKIKNAIASVAAQNYKNIEHIVVDGGSQDDTLPIVRACQKKYPYIRLISEPDSGLYDAMNKGLKSYTGDWIYFLGNDDRFYNKRVLSDLLKLGAFSSQTVVYGNVHILGNALWAKNNEIYDGQFTLEKLLKKNICHQAVFYPRTIVEKVGFFNEKYNVCADWDYNLRCYAHSEFVYVNRIIAYFTAGGYSTSARDQFISQDFGSNVLKYFKIDPDAEQYMDKTSPFSEIVSTFKNERLSLTKTK